MSDQDTSRPSPSAPDPYPQPTEGQQPTYPEDSQPASPEYPQAAYPQAGYPQAGYPQAGHPQAGYPQPGAYATYGYPYPAAPANNGLAIASLVLGIAGLFIVPIIGSIAAVIMGHVARKQIRERGEGGDGMAVGGLVTGYIGGALWLAILVFAVLLPIFLFAASSSSTVG